MIRPLACLLVTLGCSLATAQPTPPRAESIDCRMLAGIPNAPMTVETCERRMAAHAAMISLVSLAIGRNCTM